METNTSEKAATSYPPISKSSRFNLKLMWNMNKFSIAVFVIAILIKLIHKLFFSS